MIVPHPSEETFSLIASDKARILRGAMSVNGAWRRISRVPPTSVAITSHPVMRASITVVGNHS